MYNVLFLLCLNLFMVNAFTSVNHIKFLKNNDFQTKFRDIICTDIKQPIILDGKKSEFKRDYCKTLSESMNIKFIDCTFDNLMLDSPHLEHQNSIIYVTDFLVGHGRILNHFEEEKLHYMVGNSNLVILQSDNLDRIPFKDSNIIRRFPVIKFPNIDKKDIVHYIYDVISLNKYNNDLYLINWNSYDVEKWNFKKINNILSELNGIMYENMDLKAVIKYLDNFCEPYDMQ